MSRLNYVAAGLTTTILSLTLVGSAAAQQSPCDMKILNRPGCEVGDFGPRDQLAVPPVPALSPQAERAFGALEPSNKDSGAAQEHMMQSVPVQLPQSQSLQEPTIAPQRLDQADPDSSANMQLLWDEWHKRVAAAIWTSFTSMAHALFAHSSPMAASCAYTVTKDGHITNVHMIMKNMNPTFNAMVLAAVASIDGNTQLLAFPPGSKRMTVDKSGTFTQNYGAGGFKYITNDREMMPERH